MARDEDSSGGKVKALVPLVIRGVPEEDTESGAGVQLVGRRGSGVGVTRTPKDAKVIVPRRGTEKSVV
jgi:YbbR domain-containing protein